MTEKIPIENLVITLLQMIQHMTHLTNMEAVGVLHRSGWCKDFKRDEEE
jgi:hypothetical protein